MEIKECYRVLELEVGASRDDVEGAYLKLLERWHPDRAAQGGPESIRNAEHMVQLANEAYRTLSRIAPVVPVKPPPAAGPAGAAAPGRPTSAPAPPPARSGPPARPEPPAAAPRPPSAPVPGPLAPAAYVRRYGPIAAAVVLLLLVMLIAGKCSAKPAKKAEADPKTTGRVLVTSNRANTTIEATRDPAPGAAAAVSFHGTGGGAAEHAVAGVLPGRYALTAHSDGWPDIHQEVTVDVGRATEVAVHFKSGSLRLDSIPDRALVRWGEADLGKTPVTVPELPVGEVQLSLEYPGWPVQPYKVNIIEGKESTETVRLPHGRLVVESTPPGATVQLEAQVVGKTPLTLERVPAGTRKVTLRADNFVPVAFAVTIADNTEAKLSPVLTSSVPVLDPTALLSDVWLNTPVDRSEGIAPAFSQITNFQPKNGIIKNLDRKKLWESWLRKKYRFSAAIKSYDKDSGVLEFLDQNNENSKYRVIAHLSIGARSDKALATQLVKGTTFALYGTLEAVEEPRWPSKVITLEFSPAEPQR